MNCLEEKQLLSEMACGTNFAYILQDNTLFLPTEYKVLQSQPEGIYVRCMKMLYNGKIQLYYSTAGLQSLQTMLPQLDAGRFLSILASLFSNLCQVKSNGFLTCKNIDASFARLYIEPSTCRVRLVYLPLKRAFYPDDYAFLTQVRTELIRVAENTPGLDAPDVKRAVAVLQNGTLGLEDLCLKLNGKSPDAAPAAVPTQAAPQVPPANTTLHLIAVNAGAPFQINVTKSVFLIGKNENNDGVISFNQTVSRVHCKITSSRGQYWITDMQSSNGTFVNQVRLTPNQPHGVKNGDMIRLSNVDFQVRIS